MDTVSVQRIRSNLAQIFSRVDADFNGGLKTDTADSSESQEVSVFFQMIPVDIYAVIIQIYVTVVC